MQKIHATLQNGVIVQEHYSVVDILGRGGFSAVYLVENEQNGTLFALKELIDQDKAERIRFTFECAVLERLDHPALPRVHRVFEENNRAYMLMDYVEGPNLEVLRRKQPADSLPLDKVFTILEPIISALSYLHSQEPPIIHRDLKPSNIIVPQEGGNAVLVDFGIAKEFTPDSTTTAIRHCSPGYGAPEQYALGTDLRTDIYGLGATFYALLTGRVPIDSLQRATQLGTQGIDPLIPVREYAPHVPQYIADAIQRAMSIGPNNRFNSVDEFWQAMNGKAERDKSDRHDIVGGRNKLVPVSPISAPLPVIAGQVTDTGDLPALAKYADSMNQTDALNRSLQSMRGRLLLMPPVKKLGLLVQITLALLLILAVGLGVWAYTLGTHPAHTARSTLSATTAHVTRTTLPTPSPSGVYPSIALGYAGKINDLLTNVSTIMTITQVQQNGAVVKGTFNGLHETAPFNGVLDTSRHIFFTVAPSGGHSAIFFQGNVRSDSNLVGNFCDVNAAGECINDYGVWSIAPGA